MFGKKQSTSTGEKSSLLTAGTTPHHQGQDPALTSADDDATINGIESGGNRRLKRIDRADDSDGETAGGGDTKNGSSFYMQEEQGLKRERIALHVTCALIGILAAVAAGILVTLALVFTWQRSTSSFAELDCSADEANAKCTYQLVESIPDQLEQDLALIQGTRYTHEAWNELVDNAKSRLRFIAFYWSLLDEEGKYTYARSDVGTKFFNRIKGIVSDSKNPVKIDIVQNLPTDRNQFPNIDTTRVLRSITNDTNKLELVELDWAAALGGIVHTKAIIADDDSFYLGSANMDWRSLTQVKELGVYVKNCPCLARDLGRLFEIYKKAGKDIAQMQQEARANNKDQKIDPTKLPFYRFASFKGFQQFDTPAGEKQRYQVKFNGASNAAAENGTAFFSSAPAEINSPGRTNDIVALINTINNATKFVYASVMEYQPMALYVPKPQRFWWPELDTALRNAVMRNVTVHLMVSKWNYTDPAMYNMMATYESMRNFCNAPEPKRRWCTGSIQIKIMDLPDPSYSPLPDHIRVNHAKYCVTDKQAYISTSNWSWDYFYTTAGISFVSDVEGLRSGVQKIFERDWASKFCHPLTDYFKLEQNGALASQPAQEVSMNGPAF